tara:strand:+ start:425 stop:9202 length:8778 start_codon:yes stop_codon:yes gene_type:complete
MRLGLPLAKSGFSSGPKAGHKYWRRVRVMVRGRLSWRYYYNTPEDRAKYAADRKKKKHKGKHEELAHLSHEEVLDILHIDREAWPEHFAEFSKPRIPLRELTAEKIFAKIGWTAPDVTFDAGAYAVMRELENSREPENLYGEAIHPLRAMEAAVNLLPAEIQQRFGGTLKRIEFFGEKREAVKANRAEGRNPPTGRAGAWANYDGGITTFPLDTSRISTSKSKKEKANLSIDGANSAVSIFLHEWAHLFSYNMGADRLGNSDPADGPNWADWEKIAKRFSLERDKKIPKDQRHGRPRGEKGITAYANKDIKERFCESFAAALMTPKELSESCPIVYEFMHRLMPSAVPPLKEMQEFKYPKDMVAKFVDPWFVDDEKKETLAQTIIADVPQPEVAPELYALEPADPDKIGKQGGADRFYEMNFRGRTIFFRIGKKNSRDKSAEWEAPTAEKQVTQLQPSLDNIKECYDESGNPVDPAFAYWHLVQDVLPDDTVIATPSVGPKGKKVKKQITMQYVEDNGGMESDDPWIKAVFGRSKGAHRLPLLLRSFSAGKVHDGLKRMQKLHDKRERLSPRSKEYSDLTKQIDDLHRKIESQADRSGDIARRAGNSFLPMPVSMLPHEVTATHFRQKSGTFNYDRWERGGGELFDQIKRAKAGSRAEMALLERMKIDHPGLLKLQASRVPAHTLVPKRDKKTGLAEFEADGVTPVLVQGGGRWQKHVPYFEVINGKRIPAQEKRVYLNVNPDGTKTKIETYRGDDGRYRLRNRMWAALLTPNGEEITSAEHLETLCRVAARNRHKAWISIKTDRERFREGGKVKVGPAGDLTHNYHLEVEFDGAGQPRILGDNWKKRLGKDHPRLDDLISTDHLGDVLDWAKDRVVVPAPPVVLGEEKVEKGLPEKPGDRVLLTTRKLDWKTKADLSGRVVVAKLLRKIPGKKAGDPPPAPGWDRMPEGADLLEREMPPGVKGTLSKKMKALIGKGLLPAWYNHSPLQAEWYRNTFVPAYAAWENNFERMKAEAYDPVYIFSGETGMGGGSNVFRRVGDADVAETVEWATSAPEPEPMPSTVLAHHHKIIDPRNGATIDSEVRLYAPKDGSIPAEMLSSIEGVIPHYDDDEAPEKVTRLTTTVTMFPKVRAMLGGLSLTGDITEVLDKRNEMLKAAERQRLAEAHELQLEQIAPKWAIDNWGSGLNTHLPDGSEFKLARHQSEGLQKLFDNDLRVLLAHYMGTGKTVTALTACKMAMSRPKRAGVPDGQGIPDDLVGADREKWLADHPFVPGTLDSRNPTRCLIVAPLNTTAQWRQAASDFDEGAIVVGSGANDIPIDQLVAGITGDKKSPHYKGDIDPDMVVVGPQYYTIHADKLKKCGFDGLVVDEVHQGIKNEAAERNKVVNKWNPDMKMMLLLTGTPMTTSPADFVEYVRLLSKGKQWSAMDKKAFIAEYLMKTPIPGMTGANVSAPKIAIRPEKRAEFAAILAQWMNIALPKHVAGKILPAVRIDDTRNATMVGTQMDLYNLYMATLNAFGVAGGLTEEEAKRLGGEAKRAANSAKGVMNCIGYKPGGEDPHITVQVKLDADAAPIKQKWRPPNPEELFSREHRKGNAGKWPLPEELQGGEQSAGLLNIHFQEVLGMPYSELAGKKIGWGIAVPGDTNPFRPNPTKKQIAEAKRRMAKAGWPDPVPNPEAGPVGLRFRGTSELWNAKLSDQILRAERAGNKKVADALRKQLRERGEELLLAQEFQRAYRHALEFPSTIVGEEDDPSLANASDLLKIVAKDWDVSIGEAQQLLAVVPNPSVHNDALIVNDKDFGDVELRSSRPDEDGRPDPSLGDQFVSDTRGSLHLLYRPEDLGDDGLPKSPKNASFDDIKSGESVKVGEAALKKVGIKRPTSRPEGMSVEDFKEFKKNWAPPIIRYDATIGENAKGHIGLISEGPPMETIYVPKKDIAPQVKSLMDPGMRKERFKADLMMTVGNAKTDEVQEYIEQFHDGSGAGPDGERQIVLFANDILTGCRTLEAKLRLMGYADVNEALETSYLHDPEDPRTKGGTSPNGKYFVTYIGSTYTGDREQNTMIFKKVKDSRGRDSKTSLFVHNLLEARRADRVKTAGGNVFIDWKVYPGDHDDNHLPEGVASVQMSNLSPEQRIVAKQTLGINAPESYVTRMNGESPEKSYFYGVNFADVKGGAAIRAKLREQFSSQDKKGNWADSLTSSQDLLSMIVRSPDPSKIKDPVEAAAVKKRIAAMKKAYSELAANHATMEPPIDSKQISVFNNCEVIVCSDAAQVGMNLGNSSELGAYDSLGSPMAEWQRYTRCARMLPEAVPEKLMGKPIMEVAKVPVRAQDGQIVMEGGKPKMEAKKVKNPETGKLEVVKVQARDERGRFRYSKTGLFDKLRKAEPKLFDVENREMPQGAVRGLQFGDSLGGGDAEAMKRNKARSKRTMPISEALQGIAEAARVAASKTKKGRVAAQWESIVAKAEMAINQGGQAAIEQLSEFKAMKAPESAEALIRFPETGLKVPEFDEGTYAGDNLLDTRDVERVIGTWFEQLDDIERTKIMDAGFVHATPPNQGSFDAKEVYLAMRSQEILMWVDNMRPVVGDEMRKGEGGEAITDEEVTNRLIDMLSPVDRAVLKTKKYLVNVRKFGAGGAVGQVTKHRYSEEYEDENGKTRKRSKTDLVHTGYENQNLVSTDVRTRMMGRGRTVSNEQIMTDVQAGIEYKADTDFEQVSAREVVSIAVRKALALVFDLSKIGDNPIVANNSTDLAKGGGPFVGPKGGKWADAKHTIPWKEGKPAHKQRKHAHSGTTGGWHNDHKQTSGDQHEHLQQRHNALATEANHKMSQQKKDSNAEFNHRYERDYHLAMADAHGTAKVGKLYGPGGKLEGHHKSQIAHALRQAREAKWWHEGASKNVERDKLIAGGMSVEAANDEVHKALTFTFGLPIGGE